MTTKYNKQEEVPTEILVKRLDELSDAVVARMQGNNAKFQREFTCRIPAELDRDADLVLNGAAMRISELVKRIAELEQELTDVKSNYNCRCSHKACRVCEQRESINKVLGIGGDV